MSKTNVLVDLNRQEAQDRAAVKLSEASLRAAVMIQREVILLEQLLADIRSGVMECDEWPDMVKSITEVNWKRHGSGEVDSYNYAYQVN
jgi:hypothetical protein